MWEPERGTIVYVNNKPGENYGFITPDKLRADGKKRVFFHCNSARAIVEASPGELDLEVDTEVELKPRVGDTVVYFAVDHTKGPEAFMWNYVANWKKAQAIIASRISPRNSACRIVRENNLGQKTTLWAGDFLSLMEIISQGESTFLQDKVTWYHTVWCEECKVQGWERMWNPLDPSHPCQRQRTQEVLACSK